MKNNKLTYGVPIFPKNTFISMRYYRDLFGFKKSDLKRYMKLGFRIVNHTEDKKRVIMIKIGN